MGGVPGGLVRDAPPVQVEAEPADVGLSAGRLALIGQALGQRVAHGEIPGAVAVVHRAGRLAWLATAGVATADAIFRIYSMTKPLTSVAALSLVEEGRLDLADPIGDYLPEMRSLRVAGGPGGGRTVPARQPVLVHDLLRHTAGFAGGYSGSAKVSALYQRSGVVAFDHTRQMAEERTSADLVRSLSALPLAHQPGTVWEYSRAGDVLGRVVEVAAGQSLGDVLQERVLGPLGMKDTGLFVPASSVHRIVQPLTPFRPGTELVDFTTMPAFQSGGSGAYSTAADYLRFALMVLGQGKFAGRRIIGRKTLALMTADHLGPLAGTGPDYIPGPGYGFGLGFAVRTAAGMAATPGSAGDLWWLGRASTCFLIDPQEELAAVLMTQCYWAARRYQAWFRKLVHQALDD
jgi:CubicO group peptidase (beta-lactamase class C family)